jgi:hypothetical protein
MPIGVLSFPCVWRSLLFSSRDHCIMALDGYRRGLVSACYWPWAGAFVWPFYIDDWTPVRYQLDYVRIFESLLVLFVSWINRSVGGSNEGSGHPAGVFAVSFREVTVGFGTRPLSCQALPFRFLDPGTIISIPPSHKTHLLIKTRKIIGHNAPLCPQGRRRINV